MDLLAKAPAHLREELAEDNRRMIYAESREAVEHARIGFARKWKLHCKTVSASFEEAGDELFTFTAFPISQWKALRTTNALERINEEFRRRTKTQASLPSEERVRMEDGSSCFFQGVPRSDDMKGSCTCFTARGARERGRWHVRRAY